LICDHLSHVYLYEGGGIAFNSGASVRLIEGNYGRISADQVLQSINNPDDVHRPISSLVSLENTANRGGGSCYEFTDFQAIKEVCLQNNLKLHLDGARLFNALVAKKDNPLDYGKTFDSISICLSKGLGAPVGSVLLGNKDFIRQARRFRKVFGGGMRQAGFIAAGALYAIKYHVERLAEDHHHAQLIADALQEKDFVRNLFPVETNIVIFEVNGRYSAKELSQVLAEKGILVIAMTPTIVRMVMHLDVNSDMISQTIRVIQSL
jgi:threonine aldolase